MKTVVLAVALVIAVIMLAAEGQDTPSCASELIPCGDYLNATTKPPAKCCDPLKKAVNEQLVCLCNLYNSPDLLKSLKINVTQALRLPTLCGVADNLCQGVNNSTNTTSPNVPASGSPKDNNSSSKNRAERLASTGIFGSLLVWASLMLF